MVGTSIIPITMAIILSTQITTLVFGSLNSIFGEFLMLTILSIFSSYLIISLTLHLVANKWEITSFICELFTVFLFGRKYPAKST